MIQLLRRPVEYAQYVSTRYTERLAEAAIEPSAVSKGDSYDIALAEIKCFCKAEFIRRRAPLQPKEAEELATLEWVLWFDQHRQFEPLEGIPPAGAKANSLCGTRET